MTVLRRHVISGDVVEWRRCVLREAGFDASLARELAGEARVDLHDLLNLVDRGWTSSSRTARPWATCSTASPRTAPC